MGIYGEVGAGVISYGDEHLAGAGLGGTCGESAEEAGGKALVGVAVGRCCVVEDPKDLLCEGYVVGLNGGGTVNK